MKTYQNVMQMIRDGYDTADVVAAIEDEHTNVTHEQMAWLREELARRDLALSAAAMANVLETSCDVWADVQAIRSGAVTRESLLAHCLDGADEDRVQGWHDYVDAVVEASK